MFKKLKNSFLILNMSIMSLLMISTFSIICTLTYENIKRDNFERLQKIISLPMIETHLIRDSKVIIENRSINYIPYFKIYFTNQGSIIDTNSSVYVDDDIYKSALDLALKSNKKNSVINIDGNKWMFMVNSLPSEKAALTHETKISKRGTTSPFNLDIDTQSTYEVIFLDVTSTSKTFSNLVITFILVGIATLIIIYAISIYFANRAIKPIEEAFTKQKQFIADASHELKTPLAIINANHDVLFSNKEHTIQSQIKWLNYIEIQIGRMSKLINNLLYLAKIDYVDNSEFIKLPFNISELIEEVVLCINAISFEKGIKINLDIKNNIIIKSDSDKIRQVITILIDNAIKYSPRNYSVDIHASQKKGQFLFCISNVCKDIKEESLSKLFDRFYRTDPSRNHNDTVGYGLGLAIAKAIIEKLGGKINVRLKNNIIEFYFVLKKKVSN